MKFTEYIWELYKNSDQGKTEVLMFSPDNLRYLSSKFEFDLSIEFENENGTSGLFNPYEELIKELENVTVENISGARNLFKDLIIKIINDDQEKKYNFFFEYLGAFTTALYHKFPEYFLPYYFTSDNYLDFIRICENFEIVLPPNPNRYDQVKRTWYYFEICEIFYRFRIKHKISSDEFPAFLYFFASNCLERQEETELPKPSRIYFLGAGAGGEAEEDNWDFKFLDNSNLESSNTWGAGGLRIKKGDLVLMYCLSPRKYLHSIWKALEDSFVDPFSYYYYGVKVGYPQKIEHISFQELKNNSVFKENSTVRAHMQGLNGRPLKINEYAELLSMLEQKEQPIGDLPKLPVYNREHEEIENERDVEVQLIEPLLKDLGFKEEDWIRQLPIKMGRQTKYYPDYAILVKRTKDKEKAKIILEAKYSISSDKQLEDAFAQVRSYGLRLNSEKLILADRDYVWLYVKINGDFDSTPCLKFHWNELTNSDSLSALKDKLR
jgi:hypothetical protein